MKRNYFGAILTLFALAAVIFGASIAASAQGQIRKQTDFNGDGKSDIVLVAWRYSSANDHPLLFQIGNTPNYSYRGVTWGLTDDTPVAGDFDGDNKADFAVVRAVNNTSVWYILNSAGTAYRSVVFGYAPSANEVLVPADYDGDGKTDIAVARRNAATNTMTYYWQRSLDGQFGSRTVSFDTNNAECRTTVPGDYNGDGKADFVVRCRQASTNAQYFDITDNAANTKQRVFWGIFTASSASSYFPEGDAFVPGDYDGDGKTDLAVARFSGTYDSNNGSGVINWYIRMSSTGALMSRQYGGFVSNSTNYFKDAPAPADYDGDGKTDLAVSRSIGNIYFYWQNSSDGANRGLQFGEVISDYGPTVPLTAYVSTTYGWNYY